MIIVDIFMLVIDKELFFKQFEIKKKTEKFISSTVLYRDVKFLPIVVLCTVVTTRPVSVPAMPAFPAILLMGGKGKAYTVSLASPIAPREYCASQHERYF